MARRPDRGTIAGYSRLVRWMKVVLPVAALVTVGAIFLTGRGFDSGESLLSPADLATLGAGLRLETPRFTGRTEAGEPYTVRAAWAEPDGAVPDRITLDRPEGEIDTADGRRLSGRADAGLLERREDRLTLRGGVVIETSDGYRFASERLALDFRARTAHSPVPIIATGPAGRIEAGAMRILRGEAGADEARIFFEAGVRVVFIPEAAR